MTPPPRRGIALLRSASARVLLCSDARKVSERHADG